MHRTESSTPFPYTAWQSSTLIPGAVTLRRLAVVEVAPKMMEMLLNISFRKKNGMSNFHTVGIETPSRSQENVSNVILLSGLHQTDRCNFSCNQQINR